MVPTGAERGTGFSEKIMSNKNMADDPDLPILVQNHGEDERLEASENAHEGRVAEVELRNPAGVRRCALGGAGRAVRRLSRLTLRRVLEFIAIARLAIIAGPWTPDRRQAAPRPGHGNVRSLNPATRR
jgi:hypothetical protein